MQGHNIPFQGMTPVTLFPTSGSRPHLLKVLLTPSSHRLRTEMSSPLGDKSGLNDSCGPPGLCDADVCPENT